MIKGKLRVNWFSADDLRHMDDSLPVSDFVLLEPFYDVCEEELLNKGFVLWDDDIAFEEETTNKGFHEIRYNCAVVRGTRRKDKFIIHELGIAYYHIKNEHNMTDIEKLSFALNNLSVYSPVKGKVEEESIKAKEYLREVIDKMKHANKSNIK